MNRLQEKYKDYHIILGSQSPRRRELLAGLDMEFEVRVKHTSEQYPEQLAPEKIPEYIAEQKFFALKSELQKHNFLITADTIVVKDDLILQKPTDTENAKNILTTLSGATHMVVTGVCIGTAHRHEVFSALSLVSFTPLSEEDINYYIEKYQPFDKAGAYGVQEWIGYMGIHHINGSYYNVMGLPVQMLYERMLAFEL
ncbi:MAG: Maf family nucleotide pyrophosphatase [Bacteroidales bacterium]|jgi:septum formation protein|nr:Maf family nucleotide pyrophosphatase [Bacteroidales bacterium]